MTQTPWTPLLLFHQVPSGTYGKIIKRSTIFPRVRGSVLATGNTTTKLLVIPNGRRIVVIRKLRLLRCPLGLGSIALGLKFRTRIIIIAFGLIPRLTIVTTVVLAGLVTAVRASGRLGRRGCPLMNGHGSGLISQVGPELQSVLSKIKKAQKFRIIIVGILPLKPLPEANLLLRQGGGHPPHILGTC